MAFKSKFTPVINYDSPEALFRDLKSRTVQGLLSHQSDIIRKYMDEALDESDVALELPTGSGKTLVGLLIGEFRRRKLGERVIYLCPTKQLVNQVVEQSQIKYGIKTTAFVGSKKDYTPMAKADYNRGDTIAVTTYRSLFNTAPFFHNPNLIILDDAHSSENYIASYWSLNISRHDHKIVYQSMMDILKDCIPEAQYYRLNSESVEILEVQNWVEKIPTPMLYEKISEITTMLDVNTENTDLYHTWSVIRGHLIACHVYLSWNSILIRPVIPPSMTHIPFASANQRLYMSATLGLGGDLERITGARSIYRLPIPEGWDKQGVGRRFFMFPEASLSEDEALNLVIEATKHTPRSLVLVPDERSANDLTEKFNTAEHQPIVYRATDLERSKLEFIQTNNALAVLANRLDGIDLVNDECRLLILKGLPRATNLQEKFLGTRMAASVLLEDRLRTRIIQATGRCTRSITDYSAVIILGQELMDMLIQGENNEYFHPELQAELDFGIEESKGISSTEFIGLFNLFLAQGDDWQQADQQIVARRNASVQKFSEAAKKLLESAQYEVDYQYAIWQENYEHALLKIEKVLNFLTGDDVKGYRGFWYYLAGSSAWLEYKNGEQPYLEVARNRFKQATLCAPAVTWLRKIQKVKQDDEPQELTSDDYLAYIIEGLETKLAQLGISSGRKFEIEVKFIQENIISSDADKFEEAHKRIGALLGYVASNTDETGGPDPWWIAGDDLCIVAEDKSDGDINTPVGVNKTRQAASHPNWIRNNVSLSKNAKVVPVMITTAKTIDAAAVPHTGEVLYWHIDDFRGWVKRAIGVIRELRLSFSTPGDIFWRDRAIQAYKGNELDPGSVLTRLQLLKDIPQR